MELGVGKCDWNRQSNGLSYGLSCSYVIPFSISFFLSPFRHNTPSGWNRFNANKICESLHQNELEINKLTEDGWVLVRHFTTSSEMIHHQEKRNLFYSVEFFPFFTSLLNKRKTNTLQDVVAHSVIQSSSLGYYALLFGVHFPWICSARANSIPW